MGQKPSAINYDQEFGTGVTVILIQHNGVGESGWKVEQADEGKRKVTMDRRLAIAVVVGFVLIALVVFLKVEKTPEIPSLPALVQNMQRVKLDCEGKASTAVDQLGGLFEKRKLQQGKELYNTLRSDLNSSVDEMIAILQSNGPPNLNHLNSSLEKAKESYGAFGRWYATNVKVG